MTRGIRQKTPQASYDFERRAIKRHGAPVAGVDEAGRGPWAGPVVAAAVVLRADAIPPGLADSKVLAAAEREALIDLITQAADVGVGIADVARIDRDNILAATLWAMTQAVAKLTAAPRVALVDGNRAPPLGCAVETMVKGDALSVSIAAASIVAKVTRDRIMTELCEACPGYGFSQHKGYGTPQHQHAISRLGVTPHHRRSFKPVRLALERGCVVEG
jgi:ribonuclease HII